MTLWPSDPQILLRAPQSLEPSLSTDAGVNLLAQVALLACAVAAFLYLSRGKAPSGNVLSGTALAVLVAASATISRQNALLKGCDSAPKKKKQKAAAMINEEDDLPPPMQQQGYYLTPAQSTLRASPDNPYGNYRLYDPPQTKVYTGPIAMPEDDTLSRMAYGTERRDPGLSFYTLPDPSGIEHMRSRVPPANYGNYSGMAESGYAKGGLWMGR